MFWGGGGGGAFQPSIFLYICWWFNYFREKSSCAVLWVLLPDNHTIKCLKTLLDKISALQYPSFAKRRVWPSCKKQRLLIWVPSTYNTPLYLGNHNFTRNSFGTMNCAWIVNLATFSEKCWRRIRNWAEFEECTLEAKMSWTSFSPLFPSLTPRAADPLWFRWFFDKPCPTPIKCFFNTWWCSVDKPVDAEAELAKEEIEHTATMQRIAQQVISS